MTARKVFALVALGALLRIAGAAGSSALYLPGLLAGGAMWTLAWGLYGVLYARVLVGPRVDTA